MKNSKITVYFLFLSLIFISLNHENPAQPPVIEIKLPPKIESSTIVKDLAAKKKQSPNLTSHQLAEFGNKLFAQKGFDYNFDVCEFLGQGVRLAFEKDRDNNEPHYKPFLIFLTTVQGKKDSFQLLANEGDAPCGECFTEVAALQVTPKEMTIFVEGKPVRLRRPKDFLLDEIALVDKTLKKVLRRWQVPFQGEPSGISADGTKIYYEFSIDEETADQPSELILELAQTGKIQLRTAQELNLKKGEKLKKFPKDKNNAYLSFIRFRRGGKTFIIRFSEPCT